MSLKPKTVDFDETWGRLRIGALNVLSLTETEKTIWMDMYSDVYSLCTAHPRHFGEETYEALKDAIIGRVNEIKEEIEGAQDLVAAYHKQWDTFFKGAGILAQMFKYLDQNWIRRSMEEAQGTLGSIYGASSMASLSEPVYEVRTLALTLWKANLLTKQLSEALRKRVLAIVDRARSGEDAPTHLVPGVVESFVELGLDRGKPLLFYRDNFECHYLAHLGEFYAREASAFLQQNSCSDYMKKAEARIEEEETRAKAVLHHTSEPEVVAVLDRTLIERYIDMLQTESRAMVKEESVDDLRRMYVLLSRLPKGIDPMLTVLEEHVSQTGLARVEQLGDKSSIKPNEYVEALLELFTAYNNLVTQAFRRDGHFVTALDRAMRAVVNDTTVLGACRAPELTAKYCDMLLKKGKLNLDDAALDERLGDIISVFRYINDKDVFQKFYSKLLAKRLVHGASVSDDAESGMLSRLKQTCGYEYTAKLQRMFTDISVSEDFNTSFAEFRRRGDVDMGGIDYSIQVLTSGSWPLQGTKTAFTVPAELEKCISTTETFYNKSHNNRKLTWLYHLCKGEVKTRYLEKNKEFVVNNFQMAVLLLFNRNDAMSVADIQSATSLDDDTLARTVHSLVRFGVLSGDFNAKKALPTVENVVELNMAFKNKRHKLKISAASAAESAKEGARIVESAMDDRRLFIQAAIVRVMKARKQLTHQLLVAEVVEQSIKRFRPNVKLIKKCVEQLIDKGYLERAPNEPHTFLYVA